MAKVEIDLDLITKEMDQLKDDKARLKFELNNVDKEIKKRELQLETLLSQAGVKSMDYGIYNFGLIEKSRTAFDQSLFKEQEPDLYEKYRLTKTREEFEFNINKY